MNNEEGEGPYERSTILMDTIVRVRIVSSLPQVEVDRACGQALSWFERVETVCSRFETSSEVVRLCARWGEPVVVSPLLFECLRFALAVARRTGGAFDPTVGVRQVERGFNRNYRTGEEVPGTAPQADTSYRDIVLDEARRTVLLRQPVLIDLGAVAKGLAIDLASRELAQIAPTGYGIDAGGDLFLAGLGPGGRMWRTGIPDPQAPGRWLAVLEATDVAICTSGAYERPSPHLPGEHHIVSPRTGRSPRALVQVTVVAPTAMLADALGTAAFVLGPRRGLRLLEREGGVEGLLVTRQGERLYTERFHCFLAAEPHIDGTVSPRD